MNTSISKRKRLRPTGNITRETRPDDEDSRRQIVETSDKTRSIVQSLLKETLANCDGPCPGYCLQNAFAFTVPGNYDHATQLESFRRNYSKQSLIFCSNLIITPRGFNPNLKIGFDEYSDDITDSHFANVSTRLEPGKTYLGKIFMFHFRNPEAPLNDDNDCLSFLKSQGAILCGAQGLSLAWQCAKEEFPLGNLFSMDEKRALGHNEDNEDDVLIPVIRQFPENCWNFGVTYYGDGKKFRDIRVLCICEMPS